jgi:hypothetical protein
MALSGGIVLEEAVDMSSDRLLMNELCVCVDCAFCQLSMHDFLS